MRLTIADVEHVAALARLGLDDAEKERLRDQLSSILDHIADLEELDTAVILPNAQVVELTNVMRPDEVRPSLPREVALANAPAVQDGGFLVPSPQA